MTPEQRLEICKSCDQYGVSPLKMYKDNCQQCFCYMPIKVKIPESTCPLGKW